MIYLFLLTLLISCQSKSTKTNLSEKVLHQTDTLYVSKPKRDWQKDVDITHNPHKDSIAGKPVYYYLEQPNCSGIAKDFYFGRYRPTDDQITIDLLTLATTEDSKLRPFYLWCLHKTILISDGALSELIGVPARKFIEKYPLEFMTFIKQAKTPNTHKKWLFALRYSGFYDLDLKYEDMHLFVQRLENKIHTNCSRCSSADKANLHAFLTKLLDKNN